MNGNTREQTDFEKECKLEEMLTQGQLRICLGELGIVRSERVLIDWREKGLLPPLRQASFGRGGSKWFWDDSEEVVEQAIAAHYLLRKYARTSEALIGLWQSGYLVDAKRAQDAWVHRLERQKEEVEKAAPRFKDGYLGVGKSLWRMLGGRPWLKEFVVGLVESSFDDLERDDEDYRANIAWLLNGATEAGVSRAEVHDLLSNMISEDWVADALSSKAESNTGHESSTAFKAAVANCLELMHGAIESLSDEGTSGDDTFRFVDAAWDKANLQTVLINPESIEHVRSMTEIELDETRRSLAVVRKIVGHCVDLTSGSLGRRLRVQVQVAFMTAVGPFIATLMIGFGRGQSEWPLADSISALHDFAVEVQSVDLHRQKYKYHASERVLDKWTTTRRKLLQLWATVTKNNES